MSALLVTSEITKKATTNTVAVDMKTFQAPLGQFLSMPGYPPASYQGVTAPNADTLYSFGFFDVSKEPWVFSYPDMGDRYFLFPIYDMWTDVIVSAGARTFGQRAQSVAITGPGWHGTLPKGITHQVKSPTGNIFMIGRVYAQNTPVGGSKELLWKPRIFPLLDLIRTICVISEASAQTRPSL